MTQIENKLCEYLGKIYGGVGNCGTMRVHASPSLNKRGQAEAGGVLPPLAAVPQKPRNRDPPRRPYLDKEGDAGVKRVRRPFVPRQKPGDFSPDRASLDRGQEIFSAR